MSEVRKVTIRTLVDMKQAGRPISMLTAYEASFARLIEDAGVDCILVGDSLGNVVQGHESTLPVSVDDMVYHISCVRRGVKRALLIGDMPFLSYSDAPTAVVNAGRLMQAGAEMVKLEGGAAVVETVAALSALGVPVCGHLGLTPQSVHQLSGYRVQGREAGARKQLLADADALQNAGAAMLVLECIPAVLAAEVTAAAAIPVIGIGAGRQVDGQVLVLHDMLGMAGDRAPRFVRDFLAGNEGIRAAIEAFASAVQAGTFPAESEAYGD